MREIKFKIWNPIEKKMLGVFSIYGIIEVDKEYRLYTLELLPFTGLEDKEGTGIYEGDLIRTNYLEGDNYLYEVVWGTGVSGWRFVNPEDEQGNIIPYPIDRDAWEVIGSIYENPELVAPSK